MSAKLMQSNFPQKLCYQSLCFLGLLSLAACGGTQIGNGLTFEMDLTGVTSVGVPDAGAKLASFEVARLALRSWKSQTESGSPQLFAFSEGGEVVSQLTGLSMDIDNVWSLDRGLLIKISQTYYLMPYSTGQSVELSSEVSASFYLGQNSNGDLVFSNLKIVDLDPISSGASPAVNTVQSSLVAPVFSSMSGNFVSVVATEPYLMNQVLDTTTNQRFSVTACKGARPSALSLTLAYVNDCDENELLDFASNGARSPIAAKPAGRLSTNYMVSLASGAIGYLATQGLFYLDSTGNYTLISSDHDQNANVVSFQANENFSVAVLANSIHWWGNSQTRQTSLEGVNLTKVYLKGSKIFYAAESPGGEPISGTLDLSVTRSSTQFNVNTKLKELVPIQQ